MTAALLPRARVPLLARAPQLHYMDSAATTQKPGAVLDAIREYYERDNANPHRGAYALSARATERYHASRERIARFIGASDADRLIFTRGTTESLNLVASAWGLAHLHEGDEIVVTALEHHANFVPWQQVARARGAVLRICELTPQGQVDLDRFAALMTQRTRVVAFPHVSNAIGTINPVTEMSAIARRTSAIIVCDGAQSAPHLALDLDRLDVDFYAFSGHKMLGPMGIGVLVGRRSILERMDPYQTGGDMIEFVYDDYSTWNTLPHKFEAGTPNVAGAVGLAAACDVLESLGMEKVRAHEHALTKLASDALADLPGVRVLGPPPDERGGVVSFTVEGIHPHDVSTILDEDNVCVRAGHHCAQPLMRRLDVPATTRASFYVYNDLADVRALVAAVKRAQSVFA